jgi:probable aminopeptidase NPEPL1
VYLFIHCSPPGEHFTYSPVCLFVQVVCERKDVFASGCAVARAFPLYSRKLARVVENTTVTVAVEFLVLEEDGSVSVVTKEEAAALQAAADGIRLAARIVDTPCNEMNVDTFVSVSTAVSAACEKCLRAADLNFVTFDFLNFKTDLLAF